MKRLLIASTIFGLFAADASAAVVAVTDAAVQGGKLVVKGTTPSPNQSVTLDGRFTIQSGAARVFSFSISNYLPSDCVVDLKAGSAIGSGLVANCGRGLSPRGGWGSAASYQVDDLVVFLGSSWRAKIANTGQRPDTHPALWEKFAARGDIGATGAAGAQGPTGPQGPRGPQGPPGPSTGPAGGDLAGSYPNPAIANGSVTSAKVKDDTEAGGGLTAADLAPASVGSSELQNNAVTVAKLLGADTSGSISFSLSAQSCGTIGLSVSGALPGDLVVMSLEGATAVPDVVFSSAYKVTAANAIAARACNLSSASISVSNLGVRVVTLR